MHAGVQYTLLSLWASSICLPRAIGTRARTHTHMHRSPCDISVQSEDFSDLASVTSSTVNHVDSTLTVRSVLILFASASDSAVSYDRRGTLVGDGWIEDKAQPMQQQQHHFSGDRKLDERSRERRIGKTIGAQSTVKVCWPRVMAKTFGSRRMASARCCCPVPSVRPSADLGGNCFKLPKSRGFPYDPVFERLFVRLSRTFQIFP